MCDDNLSIKLCVIRIHWIYCYFKWYLNPHEINIKHTCLVTDLHTKNAFHVKKKKKSFKLSLRKPITMKVLQSILKAWIIFTIRKLYHMMRLWAAHTNKWFQLRQHVLQIIAKVYRKDRNEDLKKKLKTYI